MDFQTKCKCLYLLGGLLFFDAQMHYNGGNTELNQKLMKDLFYQSIEPCE